MSRRARGRASGTDGRASGDAGVRRRGRDRRRRARAALRAEAPAGLDPRTARRARRAAQPRHTRGRTSFPAGAPSRIARRASVYLRPDVRTRQATSLATMPVDVKLVTWNVNSIRQRLERLLALLERHAPDVVCLQETKVVDADFPAEVLRAAGYASVFAGQKSYNGVAILAKTRADRGRPRLPRRRRRRAGAAARRDDRGRARDLRLRAERPGRRHARSTPTSSRGSSACAKLLEREADPARPLALVGDFNVAPDRRRRARPRGLARAGAVQRAGARGARARARLGSRRRVSRALPRTRRVHLVGLPRARLSRRTAACASTTCCSRGRSRRSWRTS